jgi:hypothetical protein
MKHIRLFENFDESSKSNIIFDWIPFDNEVNNSRNSSIPTEIGLEEMLDYCKNNSDIKGIGLYIAHKKNADGGFTRYVTTSINPVIFESAIFDSEFKKVNEIKDLDPSKISIGSVSKGSSMLGRFGVFGEDK